MTEEERIPEDLWDENGILLYVAADPETWLPQVFLTITVTEADAERGRIDVPLQPHETMQIGAYFLQIASAAGTMYNELLERPIEEREEIIRMENQLMLSDIYNELGSD